LDRYAGNDEAAASIFDDGLVEWPEDIEEPPCPEDVDSRQWASERLPERLAYIRGLLSRGMYDYGRHPDVIAGKWGISSARVKQICSEAERQLSLLQGRSQESASEFFTSRLLRVSAAAESAGSFMAAISGIKAAAELVVSRPTQKVDVTHSLVGLSDEELRQLYAKELEAARKVLGPTNVRALGSVPYADFTEESGDRITPLIPEVESDS
jgi:hypothetical protein